MNCFQETLDGACQAKCSPCASLPSPVCHVHATSDDNNRHINGSVSPDKDVINQVHRYGIQGDTLPVPSQYYSIPQVVGGKITLFNRWHMKSGKVTGQFLHFTLITLC